MSDLTEFLLARIEEDHSVAFEASTDTYGAGQWTCEPWLCDEQGSHVAVDPPRMLAECEAKRRIVAEHPIYRGARIQPIDTSGTDFGCELCHRLDALHSDSLIEAVGYCDTLRILALPYADHPDYREEWRP